MIKKLYVVSPVTIAQLAELQKATGKNKSQLVRQAIELLYQTVKAAK